MQQPNVGDVFGRLEILDQIPAGRFRCRCRRCGNDGAIASAAALHRGRILTCWDCSVEMKRSAAKHKRVTPISMGRVRVRKDSDGWALREAA